MDSIKRDIKIIIKDIKQNIEKLKNKLSDKNFVDEYLKILHSQFSNIELKIYKIKKELYE